MRKTVHRWKDRLCFVPLVTFRVPTCRIKSRTVTSTVFIIKALAQITLSRINCATGTSVIPSNEHERKGRRDQVLYRTKCALPGPRPNDDGFAFLQLSRIARRRVISVAVPIIPRNTQDYARLQWASIAQSWRDNLSYFDVVRIKEILKILLIGITVLGSAIMSELEKMGHWRWRLIAQ